MHLLSIIERYLRRTGLPPTRFGREAVGDPRLVSDLRRGREPRQHVIDRVIGYIAAQDAIARDSAGAAPARPHAVAAEAAR